MRSDEVKVGDTAAVLRGGVFTLVVIDIPEQGNVLDRIDATMEQAPGFFVHAPVVLDLKAVCKRSDFNLESVVADVRERGLIPIGVQNADEALTAEALEIGLCPFPQWRSGRERTARSDISPGHNASATSPEANDNAQDQRSPEAAVLVRAPVRSGQRISAMTGDLVAVAPVGAGAELIAEGHIHVYGPLRGRALAGVRGDESARIFCQSLEAELISIAGAYRVRDDIDENLIGQPVMIYLDEDRLVIEPLARTSR